MNPTPEDQPDNHLISFPVIHNPLFAFSQPILEFKEYRSDHHHAMWKTWLIQEQRREMIIASNRYWIAGTYW